MAGEIISDLDRTYCPACTFQGYDDWQHTCEPVFEPFAVEESIKKDAEPTHKPHTIGALINSLHDLRDEYPSELALIKKELENAPRLSDQLTRKGKLYSFLSTLSIVLMYMLLLLMFWALAKFS